ncbi:MAG: Hsp20/alpha crystallin family protein [Alphaproteobacteria bacterium]|nr:Hsp20/alpha crystallin family protein [Alphaproteobacteria bacterium]
MTARELLHLGKNTQPNHGSNPIVSFQNEMNKLFSDFFSDISLPSWFNRNENSFSIIPAIDVVENNKEFKITVELPGMDAKDVQVNCSEGYVTIKGEKKQENKEEHEGYFRQERSYGSFHRAVTLPDIANLDKAEANFKNGILTLSVPKKVGTQTKERKIEIKQAV